MLVQKFSFAALCAIVSLQAIAQTIPGTDTDDQTARLRQMSFAQNAKSAEIVPFLRHEEDKFQMIALRGLSRHGNLDALRVLELKIAATSPGGIWLINYYQVLRARILAENRAKASGPPAQRAAIKVQTFLQTLNLTVDRLNSETAKPELEWGYHVPASLNVRRETVVLRELADMAYWQRDKEIAKQIEKLGIRFDGDAYAEAKWRCALMPPDKRAKYLVDVLAAKNRFTAESFLLIQLAVDEGDRMGQAVQKKLKEVTSDPKYLVTIGGQNWNPAAYMLMRVARGLGDPRLAPVIKSYDSGPDAYLNVEAKAAYERISKGLRWCYEPYL